MLDSEIEERIRRDPMSFGRRLTQLQIGHGADDATLAGAAGISEPELDAIRDGAGAERLGAEAVRRLARALDSRVEDLFQPPI